MDRGKNHIPLTTLILGVLSCYRLAILITEDDGPADIFRKLRQWTDRKRKEEQQKSILARTKTWTNISFSSVDFSTSEKIETERKIESTDLYFLEERGKWANIDDGIRCPYCVGVWMALFIAILVYTGIADFILLFLGIAGAQAFLQGMRKE